MRAKKVWSSSLDFMESPFLSLSFSQSSTRPMKAKERVARMRIQVYLISVLIRRSVERTITVTITTPPIVGVYFLFSWCSGVYSLTYPPRNL